MLRTIAGRTKIANVADGDVKQVKAAVHKEIERFYVAEPNLLSRRILQVEIRGTEPFTYGKWLEKSLGSLPGGRVVWKDGVAPPTRAIKPRTREPRNPVEELLDSFHVIGPRPKTLAAIPTARVAVPTNVVRGCILGAGAMLKGLSVERTRHCVFVKPTGWTMEKPSLGAREENGFGLVEILHPDDIPPVPWSFPGRNKKAGGRKGSAMLRYRLRFDAWSMNILIEYLSSLIEPQEIVALVANAGFGVGMGGLRPAGTESTNDWGRFEFVRAEVVG